MAMNGIEEHKIGNTVFLVFADGLVPADQVQQLRVHHDRTASICLKGSGWLNLHLKNSHSTA
jgi:hypothetical protein